MIKNYKLAILSLFIMSLFISFSFASRLLFEGFESPFTTSQQTYGFLTTGGSPSAGGALDGGDSQVLSISNTVAHSGSQSLKWAQTPGTIGTAFNGGTYPEWEVKYAFLNGSVVTSGNLQNFTGATVLSAWLYWDCNTVSGNFSWTIQFGIADTTQNNDLGNWNENGTFSVLSMYHQWYYRQWPDVATGPANLSGVNLSAVKGVYCYSHAGDYGNETAASGTITVYIDDVYMEGPTASVPEWSLYDTTPTPNANVNLNEAVFKE
jgi:hypothetical protein